MREKRNKPKQTKTTFRLSAPLPRCSEESAEGGQRVEKAALLEPHAATGRSSPPSGRQADLAGVEADVEPLAFRTFTSLSVSQATTLASCPQAEKPRNVSPRTKMMQKPQGKTSSTFRKATNARRVHPESPSSSHRGRVLNIRFRRRRPLSRHSERTDAAVAVLRWLDSYSAVWTTEDPGRGVHGKKAMCC